MPVPTRLLRIVIPDAWPSAPARDLEDRERAPQQRIEPARGLIITNCSGAAARA
ncbi:MAG: hypothetical protein R2752_15790 [Vicinamibacterales bacterium]